MKLEEKRSILTSSSTPSSARTVSYQEFEIEKNAKNKAYFFILSNGLYDAFREFCNNYHSSDPHKDCLEIFYLKFKPYVL
nr:MAG TPA: hypothetical protein [Caudoviricetes sp.]